MEHKKPEGKIQITEGYVIDLSPLFSCAAVPSSKHFAEGGYKLSAFKVAKPEQGSG